MLEEYGSPEQIVAERNFLYREMLKLEKRISDLDEELGKMAPALAQQEEEDDDDDIKVINIYL